MLSLVQTQTQMEYESLSSSKNDSQQDRILIYISDEEEYHGILDIYGIKSNICDWHFAIWWSLNAQEEEWRGLSGETEDSRWKE